METTMTGNEESIDCPWGSKSVVETSSVLTGVEATEDPLHFAVLVSMGACGVNGDLVYVANRHPALRLLVTVRTTWLYQGQPYAQTQTYALEPGGEAEVGCTIPGPTGQRFDRDIVGARFA